MAQKNKKWSEVLLLKNAGRILGRQISMIVVGLLAASSA